MMRHFLIKYIRPPLKKIGFYTWSFNTFFYIQSKYNFILNLFNKKFRKTAIIFTYHRIATVSNDPQSLCVSPALFTEQVEFFKNNFEIISLPELANRLKDKKLDGNEMVITFDDGYRDNLTNALPILEKYNIPATIFVCTAKIGEQASFPWDLEYSENDRAYFLSADEIRLLSKHPLIEIGAHTHSHSRLSTFSNDEQLKEISLNLEILKNLTEKPITSFAYPFGGIFDYNSFSKKILKDLGLRHICNTTEQLVTNSTPYYNLPRFNMRSYTVKQLTVWYK